MIKLHNALKFGTVIAVIGISLAGLATAHHSSYQNSTGWLNHDRTGGKGDYELFASHFRLECGIDELGRDLSLDPTKNPKGYYMKEREGCWCINAEADGGCKDIKVRFSW